MQDYSERYIRQVGFAPLGTDGQSRLGDSSVLIVGAGGLGSHLGESLGRMGVGRLRLVDDDTVEASNLARQAMYDESDIGRPKVLAAEEHLRRICPAVTVEAVVDRADGQNVQALADGMNLILDGTDDWTSRFLLNDLAVKLTRPAVLAGVVGCEGQVLAVLPGESACLRCLMDGPPPEALEQANKAVTRGVLGPAVATIAALQAIEAVKLLAGRREAVRAGLVKLDLWANTIQMLAVPRVGDCPCCQRRDFSCLDA